MTSLDDLDLSKKEEAERLEAAQERLVALRLHLGGLTGPGELGRACCACSRAGTRAARGARSSA